MKMSQKSPPVKSLKPLKQRHLHIQVLELLAPTWSLA